MTENSDHPRRKVSILSVEATFAPFQDPPLFTMTQKDPSVVGNFSTCRPFSISGLNLEDLQSTQDKMLKSYAPALLFSATKSTQKFLVHKTGNVRK